MSNPKNQTKGQDDANKAASATAQAVSAYRWVIAFAVIGLILFLLSKWRVGYTLEYYLAVLLLFFLIVTQYQSITTLLAPFNSLSGGSQS